MSNKEGKSSLSNQENLNSSVGGNKGHGRQDSVCSEAEGLANYYDSDDELSDNDVIICNDLEDQYTNVIVIDDEEKFEPQCENGVSTGSNSQRVKTHNDERSSNPMLNKSSLEILRKIQENPDVSLPPMPKKPVLRQYGRKRGPDIQDRPGSNVPFKKRVNLIEHLFIEKVPKEEPPSNIQSILTEPKISHNETQSLGSKRKVIITVSKKNKPTLQPIKRSFTVLKTSPESSQIETLGKIQTTYSNPKAIINSTEPNEFKEKFADSSSLAYYHPPQSDAVVSIDPETPNLNDIQKSFIKSESSVDTSKVDPDFPRIVSFGNVQTGSYASEDGTKEIEVVEHKVKFDDSDSNNTVYSSAHSAAPFYKTTDLNNFQNTFRKLNVLKTPNTSQIEKSGQIQTVSNVPKEQIKATEPNEQKNRSYDDSSPVPGHTQYVNTVPIDHGVPNLNNIQDNYLKPKKGINLLKVSPNTSQIKKIGAVQNASSVFKAIKTTEPCERKEKTDDSSSAVTGPTKPAAVFSIDPRKANLTNIPNRIIKTRKGLNILKLIPGKDFVIQTTSKSHTGSNTPEISFFGLRPLSIASTQTPVKKSAAICQTTFNPPKVTKMMSDAATQTEFEEENETVDIEGSSPTESKVNSIAIQTVSSKTNSSFQAQTDPPVDFSKTDMNENNNTEKTKILSPIVIKDKQSLEKKAKIISPVSQEKSSSIISKARSPFKTSADRFSTSETILNPEETFNIKPVNSNKTSSTEVDTSESKGTLFIKLSEIATKTITSKCSSTKNMDNITPIINKISGLKSKSDISKTGPAGRNLTADIKECVQSIENSTSKFTTSSKVTNVSANTISKSNLADDAKNNSTVLNTKRNSFSGQVKSDLQRKPRTAERNITADTKHSLNAVETSNSKLETPPKKTRFTRRNTPKDLEEPVPVKQNKNQELSPLTLRESKEIGKATSSALKRELNLEMLSRKTRSTDRTLPSDIGTSSKTTPTVSSKFASVKTSPIANDKPKPILRVKQISSTEELLDSASNVSTKSTTVSESVKTCTSKVETDKKKPILRVKKISSTGELLDSASVISVNSSTNSVSMETSSKNLTVEKRKPSLRVKQISSTGELLETAAASCPAASPLKPDSSAYDSTTSNLAVDKKTPAVNSVELCPTKMVEKRKSALKVKPDLGQFRFTRSSATEQVLQTPSDVNTTSNLKEVKSSNDCLVTNKTTSKKRVTFEDQISIRQIIPVAEERQCFTRNSSDKSILRLRDSVESTVEQKSISNKGKQIKKTKNGSSVKDNSGLGEPMDTSNTEHSITDNNKEIDNADELTAGISSNFKSSKNILKSRSSTNVTNTEPKEKLSATPNTTLHSPKILDDNKKTPETLNTSIKCKPQQSSSKRKLKTPTKETETVTSNVLESDSIDYDIILCDSGPVSTSNECQTIVDASQVVATKLEESLEVLHVGQRENCAASENLESNNRNSSARESCDEQPKEEKPKYEEPNNKNLVQNSQELNDSTSLRMSSSYETADSCDEDDHLAKDDIRAVIFKPLGLFETLIAAQEAMNKMQAQQKSLRWKRHKKDEKQDDPDWDYTLDIKKSMPKKRITQTKERRVRKNAKLGGKRVRKPKIISGIKQLKQKFPKVEKVWYDGEWVFKCPDCDYTQATSVALFNRHRVRHQKDSEVQWLRCGFCNYKARRRGNLLTHMILHRDPQDIVWFKCDFCEKKFKHRNTLKEHEKRHQIREGIEQYECNQCPYKSPFKHTFLRHKWTHEKPDESKRLKCDKCSYSTFNKYYLKRHGRCHRAPEFKCVMCKYTCRYKSNLEIHMVVHYPKDELFYCDYCNFSTNRRFLLQKHSRKKHNLDHVDGQTYYCHNCSYQTTFKRCLVKHMEMHIGVNNNLLNTKWIKTEPEDVKDENSGGNAG